MSFLFAFSVALWHDFGFSALTLLVWVAGKASGP